MNSDAVAAPARPPEPETDLSEAAEDAAVALAGISDALEYRIAIVPDDMLEMLAETAADRAAALREALSAWGSAG